MLQSGRVNHQGHREEGPERTGLQHKRRQRRRQDKKQPVTIPCQAVRDHLRQPTVETDVIEQNIAMDAGTARVMTEQIKECCEWIKKKVLQQRSRSKQPARRSLTDDEAVTKRLKREATIAAIKQEILKTDTERPEVEQAHKFYANIRTMREPRVDSRIKNDGDQQVERKRSS